MPQTQDELKWIKKSQLVKGRDRYQHPRDDGGVLRAANYFKNKLQRDLDPFFDVHITSNGWRTNGDLWVKIRSVAHGVSFALVCPLHAEWMKIIGESATGEVFGRILPTVDYSPERIREVMDELETKARGNHHHYGK